MTVGHWYANGRLLMDASQSTPFKWNGSTTNYALYAALVNSSIYGPTGSTVLDDYNDTYLSTAIANSAEPAQATGYQRMPIHMAPVVKFQKTNPTSNYIIYPVNASYPLSWAVSGGQTMTAGIMILYWDLNVANSLVPPLTAYYPSGTNNTYDSTSPLLGWFPFIDAVTGNNYWAGAATVPYTCDATSFTGYSTLLYSQER
jgi:hypothetical protein